MTAPKRIQRRRTKGWRMPDGAVYVGRPTRWGNPWRIIREDAWRYCVRHESEDRILGVFDDGASARYWAVQGYKLEAPDPVTIRAYLRHRDLVCWCPLDQPCHADVLLEIANAEVPA